MSEAKPLAARPFAPGDALDHTHLATGSNSVGALAGGCAAGLHGGSRMSRDVHVRFCESLGVRSPGATHRVPRAQRTEKVQSA